MEILAFVDEKGRAEEPFRAGSIVKYSFADGEWAVTGYPGLAPPGDSGLQAMRLLLAELLAVAAGCEAAVARKWGGILAYELEKAGLITWELEGDPLDYLDLIAEESSRDCRSGSPEGIPARRPGLEDLGEGRYSISLIDVQRSDHAISSKQVLVPLLSKGDYRVLTVICGHMPPWLEVWMAEGRVQGRIVEYSPQTTVIELYGNK